MRRFEFKYILPRLEAREIHRQLLNYGMEPDPKSKVYPKNTYPVTSLYFDTPFMADYQDKAGGFLRRKKMRIRIYTHSLSEETPEIWLEKKEKYEMRIAKNRILLDKNDYRDILYGSRLALFSSFKKKNKPEAETIFYSLFRDKMKPNLITRYLRTPLISQRYSGLRITFDSNIEACKSRDLHYTQGMMLILPSNQIVMEVKFSEVLPFWFKTILKGFNLSRTSFSKYGKSVEAIYQYNPIPR